MKKIIHMSNEKAVISLDGEHMHLADIGRRLIQNRMLRRIARSINCRALFDRFLCHGAKRYVTSEEIKLTAGNHRCRVEYRIISNPLKRSDMIQAMIANWRTLKTFRGVDIPGKECESQENNWRVTQLDLKIENEETVEFRVSLICKGMVQVRSMEIAEKEQRQLPQNPRVLFILESRPDPTGCVHQGFSAIAAYLMKNGIESHAALTESCDDKTLYNTIGQYNYEYVAFSVLSGIEAMIHLRIEQIKVRFPKVKVIIGGPHVTITEDEMMRQNKDIDFAVVGEGEMPCLDLLSGKKQDQIPGLIWRNNGKIIKNEKVQLAKQLSEFPVVMRDNYLCDDWQVHSLLTSRGCPYRCQFCSSSRIWGSRLRFRPIEQIDQELRWLYENADHGLLVVVNDDMFNIRKNRTLELMKIFKKYPFNYYARGVRADMIDAEIAKEMKAAGITGCGVGIESADNESLKLMLKSETIEEIERSINHLKDHGILVCGQFMIGNIGDTLETVKKSIEFAKKLHSASFYSAVLYPGTPLTEYILKNNYKLTEPYFVTNDSPSTGIYFETPIFPLKDRMQAIRLAYDAGFIHRFPKIDNKVR